MLEYIGVRVRDLDRSRRFYCDGLGLVRGKSGRMSAGGLWEELRDPVTGHVLELNYYPDQPPYREGDELDHLGFHVDELDATIARLERLGGTVRIPPFREGGERLAFLADPDGIWVELWEEASAQDAPASRPGE